MSYASLINDPSYKLSLMYAALCTQEKDSNDIFISKAEVSFDFWHQRIVTIPGHGQIGLDELTECVHRLAHRMLDGADYEMGTEITNKIRQFYEVTDPEADNLGAQIINFVQSFFRCLFGHQHPSDWLKDDPVAPGILVLMFEQAYREFKIHSISN